MTKYLIICSCLIFSASLFAQSLGDIAESGTTARASVDNAPASRVSKKSPEPTQTEIDSIVKKAESGDSVAQLALGSFYAKGEAGFSRDADKALEWLGKSAAGNNATAMAYLGYLYAEGKLLKRDMKKAVEWRELAAERGDAAMKWTLGSAYLYGFMVPKNQVRALHWIALAADGGYVEAMKKLVEIYKNLNKTEEVAKWNAYLDKVRLLDAEKGDVSAMFDVAEKYMSGSDGLPRHRIKAIYWYKKAAEGWNKSAMEEVAKMYARGKFLPKNHQKAMEYFEKLAELDFSYCFKISSFYADGKYGFPLDEEKSLAWFAKGAERGDSSTKLHLVFKYWSVKRIGEATELCRKLVSETERILKEMESNAQVAKSARAEMERKKLKILNKTLSLMTSGAPAPTDMNAYFNSL